MKRLFLLLLYIIILLPSFAAKDSEVSDSISDSLNEDPIQFALLTCSPGELIYELYGHTAIRYTNMQTGDDWVFNYGVFDFNTPNFVLRFLTAACDYELGVVPFDYFCREYGLRGSSVYQQVLNLTAAEKRKLYQMLAWNSMPEHARYRYNLLYDNCTTRARDRIEEAIDGEVIYSSPDSVLSYRQIIHQFTVGHPWSQEGNDLCLGVEADRPVTQRQAMFAPFYYLHDAAGAQIKSPDGRLRPFVLSESKIVSAERTPVESAMNLTPAHVVALILLFTFLLMLAEWRYNCMFWGYDIILMLVQGLSGCVIAFLFFFSEHPTVGSNVQVMVLQPLSLFTLIWVVNRAVKRRFTYFHLLRLMWLTIFMIVTLIIGQDISVLTQGLAQVLLLRSVSYILFYHRNQLSRNPKK